MTFKIKFKHIFLPSVLFSDVTNVPSGAIGIVCEYAGKNARKDPISGLPLAIERKGSITIPTNGSPYGSLPRCQTTWF